MKISFFDLVGLMFITLKLCHVINWSWWFVLMPFYGSIVIIILYRLTKKKEKAIEPVDITKSKWKRSYEKMMQEQKKQYAEKNN